MVSEGIEPTMYELRGDGGLQVSYATIDLRGRPRLHYAGPHGERAYPGEEIDARDTELGREVTVTLQADEDKDTVNLTCSSRRSASARRAPRRSRPSRS